LKTLVGPCLATIAAASLASGCSHQSGVRCDSTDRYVAVRSVGPVQIPDDLTPPDESDALELPAPTAPGAPQPPINGCLDTPPKFSTTGGAQAAAGSPGAKTPEAESAPKDGGDRGSRRERRRRRRGGD
jgi:hypothetical protein